MLLSKNGWNMNMEERRDTFFLKKKLIDSEKTRKNAL